MHRIYGCTFIVPADKKRSGFHDGIGNWPFRPLCSTFKIAARDFDIGRRGVLTTESRWLSGSFLEGEGKRHASKRRGGRCGAPVRYSTAVSRRLRAGVRTSTSSRRYTKVGG